MNDLIAHFASLGRFIASHEQRASADAAALGELSASCASTLDLPAGLEVEWLGVAGYRLTFQGATVYIDPYVSRASLASALRRRPALADRAAIARWLTPVGEVLGVLVGHTHFDHAVDVPALCERHRCIAYGSSSLVALMRLHGRGEQAHQVTPHEAIELGPFKVTFVPSVHSKLLLGYRVPSDGELTCDHLDGLSAGAYRCGQVWGIHIEVGGISLYHQGSANLLDEEIRDRRVDVFLAGIAGRSFTDSYWQRILRALQPRVVVASHFDDFFRTLEQPAGFSLNVNLAAFPEEIAAVTQRVRRRCAARIPHDRRRCVTRARASSLALTALVLTLALSGCGKSNLVSAPARTGTSEVAALRAICSEAQHALLAVDHKRLRLELPVLGRLIVDASREVQTIDAAAEAKVRALPRTSYVRLVLSYLAHSRAEVGAIAQAVQRHGARFTHIPRSLIIAFVRVNSGCGVARTAPHRAPHRGHLHLYGT